MKKVITACNRCGDEIEGRGSATTVEWASDGMPQAHICVGCTDRLLTLMELGTPAGADPRDRYQAGINAGRRDSVKVKR
jgi:hypothetical protein